VQVAGLQTVLPLSLLTFTGSKDGDAVQLQFKVAEGQDITRFEIERSSSGADFSRIGTVAGLAGVSSYTYLDEHPLPTIDYYRLRMIDAQGKATYSQVVAVRMGSSAKFEVFPNPAKNVLYVQWTLPAGIAPPQTASTIVSLRIVDVAGKTMRSMSLPATGGTVSALQHSDPPQRWPVDECVRVAAIVACLVPHAVPLRLG